jgi:hypothetical protein
VAETRGWIRLQAGRALTQGIGSRHRGVLVVVMVALVAFCVLALASVGLFYLPAAVALVIAVVGWRQVPSPPPAANDPSAGEGTCLLEAAEPDAALAQQSAGVDQVAQGAAEAVGFQTTRVSPGRRWSRTCSRVGRSVRTPLAVLVNTR